MRTEYIRSLLNELSPEDFDYFFFEIYLKNKSTVDNYSENMQGLINYAEGLRRAREIINEINRNLFWIRYR